MKFSRSFILTCFLASCISSPVPQPVPFFIRTSSPGDAVQKTLVVGLPGAVGGEGKIHIRDQVSGATAVASTSGEGSFAGVIQVGQGALIELRFENADGLSEPVELRNERGGLNPEIIPSLGPPQVVSPPDGQGLVTVSNDGGSGQPPLFMATPGADVIVSNASTGAVALGRTDGQGVFSLRLQGQRGDPIHIMLSDPANPDLTSDFLSETVP